MDCETTRNFIHAHADGELDLVRSLEIERHMQECAACSRTYRNLQTLKTSLGSGSLYFQPPESLQASVRSAVRDAARPGPVPRSVPWGLLGLAAALIFAFALGWLLARSSPASPGGNGSDALAQEVVSSHVRSLMAGHLSDVASSDKHTVKPWFDGKLDFAPPVEDLASQGYPLLGGRLDYLDGRPVAALVYGRQKHIINLFIWPSDEGTTRNPPATIQGYNVIHWTEGGMAFWAVSDLNTTELQAFVQLIQNATR